MAEISVDNYTIKSVVGGLARFAGMIGRGIAAVVRFGLRLGKLFTPMGWLITLAIDVGSTIVNNWDKITASAGEADTAIGGFFRGMWTAAKLYINKTIGRINWLIGAINKIPLIDIPDIPKMNISSPSGGSSGVLSQDSGGMTDTTTQLVGKRMATGGLVTDTTQAVVGEGADDEAVVPLNERVYKRIGEGINGASASGGTYNQQSSAQTVQYMPHVEVKAYGRATDYDKRTFKQWVFETLDEHYENMRIINPMPIER
ncbi:phage tail tape measure protein [Salibacterium qingdaonense]|uniref:Uncharacterized protein n=1 Tax=Salibacterium qingdaonense TaxID=266892 RepID=A0A1I4KQV8_9BACI|nr:hypothetical protein [Salibacterium qingdaonense]SFL81164.1 hypothetical protein SAMN04488054_105172 [Salibacterium qingdaonense]